MDHNLNPVDCIFRTVVDIAGGQSNLQNYVCQKLNANYDSALWDKLSDYLILTYHIAGYPTKQKKTLRPVHPHIVAVQTTDSYENPKGKNKNENKTQKLSNIFSIGSLLNLLMNHENLPFHLLQKEFFWVCKSNTYLHCILNYSLKMKIIIIYAPHIISASVKYFCWFCARIMLIFTQKDGLEIERSSLCIK